MRACASGLRYVLYVFVTDLDDPTKVIAKPGGFFIAPYEEEFVGDVMNVIFGNGIAVRGDDLFIYYASSDKRLHVATTTMDKLLDYAFNNPEDALTTIECTRQRIELIEKNLAYAKQQDIIMGQETSWR